MINYRERTLLVVIAGLTSGIGAAAVNIAARFTDDPGDVLGLAGGALGAGLAVLGAVWLERFKDTQRVHRDRVLLADGLVQLGVALVLSLAADDERRMDALLAVRQNFDSLASIRRNITLVDSGLLARLATFDYWAVKTTAEIDNFIEKDVSYILSPHDRSVFVERMAVRMNKLVLFVLGGTEDWPVERWPMIGDYVKDVSRCGPLADQVPHKVAV